jgi:hypothetical protein
LIESPCAELRGIVLLCFEALAILPFERRILDKIRKEVLEAYSIWESFRLLKVNASTRLISA